tara:strand:+ start:1982 stop:2218 length:237 start_codon:yes stop_codon:yes gene_type:complete
MENQRITPLESDEYDPIPTTEKIASSNDRIAIALEKIASILESNVHISIDHGHIEHIDHVDAIDNIQHGDVDVHNHAF